MKPHTLFFALSLVAAVSTAAPAVATAAPAVVDGGGAETQAQLDKGVEAWREGQWTEVRNLFEPLVTRDDLDPVSLELALRYLTDATLFDESLDAEAREAFARDYFERLLDADPLWTPPPSTHGPRFYELLDVLRRERAEAAAGDCQAELLACRADKEEHKADLDSTAIELADAQTKLDSQEVVVYDRIARNRAVAFVPAGVGHFYNGRKVMGGSFLAAEVAFGAVALGLLIDRTTNLNCVRENFSFAPGAVTCRPPAGITEGEVLARRNAEQTFALLFLGTVVADVIVAQVTFKKYVTVERQRGPRSDIEKQLEQDDAGRSRRRKRNKDASAKLKPRLRPTPAFIPGGGGAGLKLDF